MAYSATWHNWAKLMSVKIAESASFEVAFSSFHRISFAIKIGKPLLKAVAQKTSGVVQLMLLVCPLPSARSILLSAAHKIGGVSSRGDKIEFALAFRFFQW
jgi:hypothetical protein